VALLSPTISLCCQSQRERITGLIINYKNVEVYLMLKKHASKRKT